MNSNKLKIKDLILIALFIVLITIGAFIKIPLPIFPVPITFQLLIVFLSGFVLKKYHGSIASLLYCLMGLFGLPIFTTGGGFTYITNLSFGYIIGFIVCSFIVSLVVNRYKNPTFKHYLLAGFVGWFALYFVALSYALFLYTKILYLPFETTVFLLSFFIIFIPNDLISLYLAIVIAKRLPRYRN